MNNSATCSKADRKIKILYIAAVLLFCSAAAFGFFCGSTEINFENIISALKNGAVGAEERIFLYVRLPRTLGGLLVGAALAVSGAVIQNVLANNLASPSIIGVNSGAGLAVTVCAVLGVYGGWKLSFFAFFGACAAVIIISLATRHSAVSRGTVILIGVALNSVLNAFSDALISFNPDVSMMSSDFKIGDLSAVTYQKLLPAAVLILATVTLLETLANELDLLTLGEENARGLGLNTKIFRTVFLISAAVLAGCAVSLAGLISFVGLVVPHAVRRLGSANSKNLIPLCGLFGAGFVSICDTAARTLFAPHEIPAGIIMAFLGAPFFVFILIKKKGGNVNA